MTTTVSILIAFGVYLLGMIGIGIWSMRQTKGADDFFLGGRGLSAPVAAMSAQASDMSGWLLMGLPGSVYALGTGQAWIAVGLGLGTIANWLIIARPLRAYTIVAGNSMTLPEFFGNRYHDEKKILLGIPWVIAKIYVTIFRGTPMIVQAMVIYYGSSTVFGIDLKPFNAAIFIILLNTGAYMSETVRGGILSIDLGQTEGAKAIGMTHVQTMLYVILPQALRNIMPQIGNNLIINIKDSCVLSVIGVAELLYKTKSAAGALYMNFETYTITMIVYFIMTFTCSRILRWLENRMDGSDNYDLATTDTLAHTSGMYRYEEKKKEEE